MKSIISAAAALFLFLATAFAARPNVVLITVDTLRADRLGCYGYRAAATPNIDRLAADGVLFLQAIAQSPTTIPSHASILTGTYPLWHGARDFGFALAPDNLTIAEALKGHGYNTAAFVGSLILDAHRGFGRGFDQGFDCYYDDFVFDDSPRARWETIERRADRVVAEALRWIEAAKTKPFFVWLHIFDPHDPYDPPEPYRSAFARSPYDGEIAFSDAALGRLFEYLKAENLYSSALIILTSDHGEGLGEHKEPAHGLFLYDSTLHVPLIIKLPENRLAGTVYGGQVRSIDIFPTALQALELPRADGIQGVGLISHLMGKKKIDLEAYAESFYPRHQFGWSELRALRSGRYKYILAPRPELYDLRSDPRELNNLHDRNLALAGQLKQKLIEVERRYARASTAPARFAHDPALLERLRSLGYAGYMGAQPSAASSAGAAADPKDKVEVYNQLRAALLASEANDNARAISMLERLIAREPGFFNAHYLIGHSYYRAGRFAEAASAFERALAIRRDDPNATLYLALARFRLDDYDSALAGFKRAAELVPSSFQAHHSLGVTYLKLKRTDEALAAFERAVEVDPANVEGRISLGRMYAYKRDFARAFAEFEAALKLDSKNARVYYYLAEAYTRAGEAQRAAEAIRKARELDPSIK